MHLKTDFITYSELASYVGCSYSTLRRRHIPKMIELYKLDLSRMPCYGMIPIKVAEDYFGIKLIHKNEKTR